MRPSPEGLHGTTMTHSALAFITATYNRNSIAALCGAMEGDERFATLPVSFVDTRGAAARLKGLLAQHSQVVAAFSFCTPNLMEVDEAIGTLQRGLSKGEFARLRPIAGGPHPSGDPEDTLGLGFECLVVGEGEDAFPALLERLVSGSGYADVAGVAYLEGGVARRTARGAPIDLDRVPPFGAAYRRFGPIEITRGCPRTCRYCQTPYLFGSLRRHRSVETVLRFAEVGKAGGLRDLRFVSPDALSYGTQGREPNLGELERLLKAVGAIYGKDHVYLGSFPSEVRPDTVTKEAVQLVKAHVANDNLVIGAQSGSQRVLDLMRRDHSVADVYRAVAIVTSAGLVAIVDVIFGLPGERDEDVRLTLKMMEDLSSLGARVHVHTFIPLAGTPLADARPGRVEGETRKALGHLAGKGKQFGSWQRQERLGSELVAFRARRR
jgi:B12-binding domain/radical SAM domain protein